MLEPLVVLTVLNCIFMFSSTVTTCALCWQHQKHRCCTRTDVTRHDSGFKKSKNYTFRTAEKAEKINGHVDVKAMDDGAKRKDKRNMTRKSKRNLRYLAEYQRRRQEQMRGPEAKKLKEKTKLSEASRTVNDTKSTVVMEFSTVQKIVQQIVDDDSEINPSRVCFKDIIIQRKDTPAKPCDISNVEQTFVTNGKNVTIIDKNS